MVVTIKHESAASTEVRLHGQAFLDAAATGATIPTCEGRLTDATAIHPQGKAPVSDELCDPYHLINGLIACFVAS
jgi:hypothetical protein